MRLSAQDTSPITANSDKDTIRKYRHNWVMAYLIGGFSNERYHALFDKEDNSLYLCNTIPFTLIIEARGRNMDRIQEMQAFVRVAERGSFSQASDDLSIPRATITNLIKRLEYRLGARLLERTTRQVRLTHDGEAYYHRCVRLLADIEESDGAFRGTMPKGLLTVNLQGTLARHFVVPALPEFLARYPGLRLHISEDDRLVDLVREGVDCVLRAGTLQDSALLIGRQVALMQQVTVASPAYLARFGEPTNLAELEKHFVVDYISSATGKAIPMSFHVDGQAVDIPMQAVISVTGADLYTSSAVAGAGIIQVPRYRVDAELTNDQLKIILPAFPPPPIPVSILYLRNRQLSPRVRLFSQWLAEIFSKVPFRAATALAKAS